MNTRYQVERILMALSPENFADALDLIADRYAIDGLESGLEARAEGQGGLPLAQGPTAAE